nr:immunoglobulin light chain junction region [Macaca mulatta]MOV34403.1 immunoglobulin light chain junction region [Macaca mulatta]MOV34510.1 immunoglobulin light chain junction region [Macaca mulatta]MOV34528.1 immunoglobulin light chain junction region [Macaca mulatta]MOV34809.1 immunoglobulin light chain junction region [Macaca mulatta]
CQQESNWPRTF